MSEPALPVATFGKIIFVPTHGSVPPLSEMSLLFLDEKEQGTMFPFRAVCIDLEMDACGNSIPEAWENLKKSLIMYIKMETKSAGGSIVEAAKIITRTAFIESSQKQVYIQIYRQSKLEHAMRTLEAGAAPNPIQEEKQRLEQMEAEQESIRYILTGLRAA